VDLLDDLGYLQLLDAGRMLHFIEDFPAQCLVAWGNAGRFAWPQVPEGMQNVVIAGMGGSAIAGELLADLATEHSSLPILIHRNYGLPACAGRHSLVIASSYSGDTEETLDAARQALRRGASVVALAAGGELGRLAAEAGTPFYTLHYQSSPRAALAHSFVSLLYFFQHLGLLPDQHEALVDAVATMQAMQSTVGARVPASANLAKRLAHDLHRRLSVIYGVGFLGSVAHRWKTQINENAKAWAFYEMLPEMNHNAVLGYQQPDDLAAASYVVLLRSRSNARRNLVRAEATGQLLERAGVPHRAIDAEGSSELAQMLSAIHLGDYVSFYLAALYGVDPTPIEAIDLLKEHLREASEAG
jgi:glucose/mannose-6-phosphate isomerase